MMSSKNLKAKIAQHFEFESMLTMIKLHQSSTSDPEPHANASLNAHFKIRTQLNIYSDVEKLLI